MRLRVDLLQARNAGVRVDLRRRQARVPKQLLHRAEVGAGIEQVRRVGMTQLACGVMSIGSSASARYVFTIFCTIPESGDGPAW